MAEQRPRHGIESVNTMMQLTKAEFAILVAGFNAGAATMGARPADRDMAPANSVNHLRTYLDTVRPNPDGSVEVLLTLSGMLTLEWCWWWGCIKVPDEDDETKSVRFQLAQKTPKQIDGDAEIRIWEHE